MKKIFAVVVLLSALLSLPLHADETQDLVNKVITTYGGEAAWRSMVGMQQEGSTYSQRRHFAGKTSRLYQHPGKMLIDIRYKEDDTELRQLDGDKGWNHGEVGATPYVLATQLQAYRLALPLLLIEHGKEVKSLGRRDDDNGNPHEGLVLELQHGMKIIMDINIDSGRIMGSWGIMEMDGQQMEFASIYEDFRQVDGRLLSFKETHYAMGDYTGYTLIEKVKFVSEFPANTFHPAGE